MSSSPKLLAGIAGVALALIAPATALAGDVTVPQPVGAPPLTTPTPSRSPAPAGSANAPAAPSPNSVSTSSGADGESAAPSADPEGVDEASDGSAGAQLADMQAWVNPGSGVSLEQMNSFPGRSSGDWRQMSDAEATALSLEDQAWMFAEILSGSPTETPVFTSWPGIVLEVGEIFAPSFNIFDDNDEGNGRTVGPF